MAAAMPWRGGWLTAAIPYAVSLVIAILMLGYRPPLPDPQLAMGGVEIWDDGGQRWQPVTLPHSTLASTDSETWMIRYRVKFDGPPPGGATATAQSWAVFVPSFTSRVIVRVNDTVITDTRWFQYSVTFNQNMPLLAVVPAPVLKAGGNILLIELEAASRGRSYLGPIYIGNHRDLIQVYNSRYFLFYTVPLIAVACHVAFAVCMTIVCLIRRQETQTLLFTGMLLCYALNWSPVIFPPNFGVPHNVIRLANFFFIPQVLLMLPLAYYMAQRRYPRWMGWTSVAFIIAFLVAYFSVPQTFMRMINIYIVMPVVICLMAYGVSLVITAAFKHSNMDAHMMAAGASLVVVLAFHDIFISYGVAAGEHLFLTRFGAPAFLLAIAVVWMGRFARALNTVDRYNIQLRQEIAAAETALRDSFAREQAREKAMVVEAERSRLTRDLHDGLAGQLMSIVAMSQRGEQPTGAISAAARHALTDLRLVIASMADVGDDLAMMLANFRDHITPQLRAMGVRLDWQMSVIPDMPGLTSSAALEIFRVLQEATTNAARHSGADTVTVRIRPIPDGNGVRLEVLDQGRGGAAARNGGYGLATMHRRAAAVGGKLTVAPNPEGGTTAEGTTAGTTAGGTAGKGTLVTLDLPFAPAG